MIKSRPESFPGGNFTGGWARPFLVLGLRKEELFGQRGPVFIGQVRGDVVDCDSSIFRERGGHGDGHSLAQPERGVFRPHARQRSTLGTTGKSLDEMERIHILRVLEDCGFNQSRAAEVLDIDRVTLRHKLKRYGWTRATAESRN